MMDCTNARLLLNFTRRGELDAAEHEALDQHLESCPDCAMFAHAEGRFDDAVAAAMHRVPVPRSLKAGILKGLARSRPRPWAWTAAAAACLLLAVGMGAYLMQPVPEINIETLVSSEDLSPESVEDAFADKGLFMVAPREFNYNLLKGFDVVEIQKRRVALLRFVARDTHSSIADVYVVSKDQLNITPELPLRYPMGSRTLEILKCQENPKFYFVIIYTGPSWAPFRSLLNVG